MKRSVVVEVAGQKLSLRTDADEDYIKSLAELVNEKIAEVKASSRTLSTHVLAALTALQIADELLQARRREADLRRRVREKSRRILDLLENAAEN